MSVACTRINNEPLCTSLLGDEKKRAQLASSRKETEPPLKLGQRNGRPVPTGFPNQQRQRQDEAYASCTHPSENKLCYSAVTRGKLLLRHPVVEQLARIGTRQAIPQQGHQKSTNNLRRHDSRAIFEELPRRTQCYLVV